MVGRNFQKAVGHLLVGKFAKDLTKKFTKKSSDHLTKAQRKFVNDYLRIRSDLVAAKKRAYIKSKRVYTPNKVSSSPDMVSKRQQRSLKKLSSRKRKRSFKKKSRRRSKRSRKSLSATALATRLQPINSFTYQTASEHDLTGGTALRGAQVAYCVTPVHDSSGASYTSHIGALNINSIVKLASLVSSSAGDLNLKYYIHDYKIAHTLVNPCNFNIYVTAYLCVARRDIPFAGQSVATTITDGFAANGIASSDMSNADLTLFQSATFCSNYKIVSSKTKKFEPGETHTYSISSKKRRAINFARYILPTDQTTTPLTVPVLYSELKGNKFYIFRLKGQVGNDSTTKTLIEFTSPKLNIASMFSWRYQYISPVKGGAFTEAATGITNTGTVEVMNADTAVVATATFA